ALHVHCSPEGSAQEPMGAACWRGTLRYRPCIQEEGQCSRACMPGGRTSTLPASDDHRRCCTSSHSQGNLGILGRFAAASFYLLPRSSSGHNDRLTCSSYCRGEPGKHGTRP